jgi:phenylacetate-CoA ligase
MASVRERKVGLVKSAIREVSWPALPGTLGAHLLALQYQLEQSQWLPRDELECLQFGALEGLLRHARNTVPYYRDDPVYAGIGDAPLDREVWARLPIVTRAQVQDAGDRLRSTQVPASHEPISAKTTSGSTGRPLTVLTTGVTHQFWLALTLREHLWHGRDPAARLAVVRPDPTRRVPPEGIASPDWGTPTSAVFATGPLWLMSLQTDVAVQAEWLVANEPDYLLTLPSNLLALAQHLRATGTRLVRLRQVRTMGEMLSADVRATCRRLLGVPIVDMYSCQELGYLALQCPAGERYHVQSEVAFVEVVNAEGAPCQPGQTGRVVVTPLHNFAMPLVRYDVGDFAEVGAPCECGRGLPVLNRIMGRQRNMLTLPTGETLWPTFAAAWEHVDAIRQIQLVQTGTDKIRARVVGPRPLEPDEEAAFKSDLGKCLGYPFDVSFEYLDRIDRSADLKFEDFVSVVPPGGRQT